MSEQTARQELIDREDEHAALRKALTEEASGAAAGLVEVAKHAQAWLNLEDRLLSGKVDDLVATDAEIDIKAKLRMALREAADALAAQHVSNDEARDLQDILRTLTPSGTALKTSARALVQAYEKCHRVEVYAARPEGPTPFTREEVETEAAALEQEVAESFTAYAQPAAMLRAFAATLPPSKEPR